jgi:putative acetyltransferase
MEICQANIPDADEIANLFLKTFRVEFPSIQLIHPDKETRQWFREVFLPGATTWVAVDDNLIVSFMSLKDNTIEKIFTDPHYQGRGTGTKLIDLAKEMHPEGLRLTTFSINHRARKLYEQLGFKLTGTDNGQNNEENEPEVVYEWSAS